MRDRTADLLNANQALSQLSYSPVQRAEDRGLKTVKSVDGIAARCDFFCPLSSVLCFLHEDKCVSTRRSGSRAFKEVIQPQVPLGLPCYDFTPVMNHKVVSALHFPKKTVRLPTSFATHSHGVTGGVYKARERIHRDILIHDY